MNKWRWMLSTVACSTLLLGSPELARAQVAAPGAPMASARDLIARSVAIDSFLALVPVRENEAIEADVERSFRQEREGSDMKSRAERKRSYVRAMQEVQEKEIERVKREAEIAREMDDSKRRDLLDVERKLRERYRDLIGDREEAVKREVELGDQQVRHARATRKRLDEERKIAADRREWWLINSPDAAAQPGSANRRASLERSILDRLKKYFEADREEAKEAGKLADKKQAHSDKLADVMERRRKLFDN